MLQPNQLQSRRHCTKPQGPRHHSAPPQSQIQGSRLHAKPHVKRLPDLSTRGQEREKHHTRATITALRHEKCLFLFPDRAPVVNCRFCELRKQTGKPGSESVLAAAAAVAVVWGDYRMQPGLRLRWHTVQSTLGFRHVVKCSLSLSITPWPSLFLTFISLPFPYPSLCVCGAC